MCRCVYVCVCVTFLLLTIWSPRIVVQNRINCNREFKNYRRGEERGYHKMLIWCVQNEIFLNFRLKIFSQSLSKNIIKIITNILFRMLPLGSARRIYNKMNNKLWGKTNILMCSPLNNNSVLYVDLLYT